MQCVKLLLAAGCDAALCNDTGRTGRELAEEMRRQDVLGYILGWGGNAEVKGIGAAAAAAAVSDGEATRPASGGRDKSEKRDRRKSSAKEKSSKEKKPSREKSSSKPSTGKTRSRSKTAGAAETAIVL